MKSFRKFARYALWIIVLLYAGTQIYMLLAVQGRFAKQLPSSDAGGEAITAGPQGSRIAGRVYLSGQASVAAPLVVVLHGDAPFRLPGYQYVFAQSVANAVPGTRVVGLLRPGYGDPYGAKSDGPRGFASGENYTQPIADDLAAAILQLKQQWNAPSVILVGHSGGAILTANIAATHPGLVQHAVLVSCPCELKPFRAHMWHLQHSVLWLLPTQSLSPLKTLDQMSKDVSITALSGSVDPIALPQYTRDYVARANARGNPVEIVMLPGLGHEILNEPATIQQVATTVRSAL